MKARSLAVILAAAIVAPLTFTTPAEAATFTGLSRNTSTPVPAATGVTETFSLGNVTAATGIACITIDHNTASDGTGAQPTGMLHGGGTANFNTGASSLFASWTDWAQTASTREGLLRFTKGSGTTTPAGATGTVSLQGLTNGTTPDVTYFVIIKTFSNNTCTTLVDQGTVAYVYTNGTTLSMDIRPTLTFTVGAKATACGGQVGLTNSNYVASGTGAALQLAGATPSVVASTANELSTSTNANGGVVIKARGAQASGNLRNASKQIPDIATAPVAGTEGLSMTVDDTGTDVTANGWAALNATDKTVLAAVGNGAVETKCVGYSAGISTNTPAGSYQAQIFYTAVPTF